MIFAAPDPEAVDSTSDEVRDRLAGSFPKIGPLMDDAQAAVLAFSTSPLERINKEIKRRSRVVGI